MLHMVSQTIANDAGDDEQGPLTNTAERIEEALGDLQREGIVELEVSDVEREEEVKIELFFRNGCGCKLNCHQMLGKEIIETRRRSYAELTKQELNLIILGQLAAFEKKNTLHRVHAFEAHSTSAEVGFAKHLFCLHMGLVKSNLRI